MNTRLLAIVASTIVVLVSTQVDAKSRMTIACQKNMDDGRILVDGTQLPTNATYKVKSFHSTSRDGTWSYGTCVIELN
jgi:hypothetical protein